MGSSRLCPADYEWKLQSLNIDAQLPVIYRVFIDVDCCEFHARSIVNRYYPKPLLPSKMLNPEFYRDFSLDCGGLANHLPTALIHEI